MTEKIMCICGAGPMGKKHHSWSHPKKSQQHLKWLADFHSFTADLFELAGVNGPALEAIASAGKRGEEAGTKLRRSLVSTLSGHEPDLSLDFPKEEE